MKIHAAQKVTNPHHQVLTDGALLTFLQEKRPLPTTGSFSLLLLELELSLSLLLSGLSGFFLVLL